MKNFIGFLLLAVGFTGCAAHMMETHGDTIHVVKLRSDKPGKGGVIRYLNTGMESWKRARRADAEKQMEKFCSGSYQIIAEGPRSKFGADMPIGSGVSLEVDQYTYVSFDCPASK